MKYFGGVDVGSTQTKAILIDETGKYLVGWRRIGGQWKAVSDIYNSDTPPAPAPAPAK